MNRFAMVGAVALVFAFVGAAEAQYYTTYYSPTTAYYAPQTVYYAPAPARVAYYARPVVAAPTYTTYYAPAPVTTYYVARPSVMYYRPAPLLRRWWW